jgi:CSLREA domain-containing protein
MTNTPTSKINRYYRTLMALALVAMMAATLLTAAVPSYATTTFKVNSVGDQADANGNENVCMTSAGTCTLRAAIEQANATFGADVIAFEISGTGVHTITPASPLPAITHQVTIDGYTQAGTHPNTRTVGDEAVLKIALDGGGNDSPGLEISNASGCVIRGLVVNGYGRGLVVSGDSKGSRLTGNFVGPTPSGTEGQGNTNEGKTFIGEKSVITSVDGVRSFTFSLATAVPAGRTITATATNEFTGETSEFSGARTVASS